MEALKKNIYTMSVFNQGTIIGEGNNNTKQAGISFNNFDASGDFTRVVLSNEGKGTITMNAPISAGMMLRPEINYDMYRHDGGVAVCQVLVFSFPGVIGSPSTLFPAIVSIAFLSSQFPLL